MFPSIVGTRRYEIVTVKSAWATRPAMPTLATSGMIGRTAECELKSACGLPSISLTGVSVKRPKVPG
jgi:hypothetical protein